MCTEEYAQKAEYAENRNNHSGALGKGLHMNFLVYAVADTADTKLGNCAEYSRINDCIFRDILIQITVGLRNISQKDNRRQRGDDTGKAILKFPQ